MKRLLALLLAAALLTGIAAAETITFSLVGDCSVADQYKYRGYKNSFTAKISAAGLDYPFSLVADLFAQDDLTIANCEGVLTSRSPGAHPKKMTLGADPRFAAVFALGNVDVCNLANNHGRDYGAKGQQDTAEALRAYGIGVFYDAVSYAVEVKGVKIGFVGYTYPFTDAKLKKYIKQMKELRQDGCTFVIASAHWGRETYYELDANQKYATKMIDAGFDMVYGHGSHTCEMIRYYKGKVIFYSLSNFTFGANSAPKDDDSVVIQITYNIEDDQTLTPLNMTAIPFKMHKNKDYRPYPIEDETGKQRVWEKLYYNGYKATRKKTPAPTLPESFLTTGYVDFTQLPITNK